MFITYGDTFLPTPSSYDELYYEIIRMHQNFDNLYSMGECLLTCQTAAALEVRVVEEGCLCQVFPVYLRLMCTMLLEHVWCMCMCARACC